MKNAYLLFLILVLGGLGFYFYRAQFLQYPVRMEIVNAKGETINATINGRNQREVFFTINNVDQEYQYPIAKLNIWSRVRLYLHPEELPSRQFSATDESLATIHRQSMVDELASLRRNEDLLEKKLESVASEAEKQTIQAEIDLVELRIKRFEYRIDRFDRDQGN
jgi:hypothetical protein